jgi:short-subunit dehydrogenase
MSLVGRNMLITGAGTGIGRETAIALARKGARLALVGRSRGPLEDTAGRCRAMGSVAHAIAFDVAAPSEHSALLDHAAGLLGGVDVLVNNAGVSAFGEFAAETPEVVSRLVATNVTGPLLLTLAFLRQPAGGRERLVVNVGSTFGSIGFPHFAAYSASKFALRGFSEALRRELAGSSVAVCYVAPRGTRTALNSPDVYRLGEKTGTAFDAPESVAAEVVTAIETTHPETYLGWPEKLVVRLNALFPRLVDLALRGQVRAARELATRAAP